jgi:hypothetical protein
MSTTNSPRDSAPSNPIAALLRLAADDTTDGRFRRWAARLLSGEAASSNHDAPAADPPRPAPGRQGRKRKAG